MKKRAKSIYASVVIAIMALVSAVTSYAQEGASPYDFKPVKHNFFFYFPVPGLIFATVAVLGMYLIYHYWANGKLTDDMS